MPERLNGAVSKTVVRLRRTEGSNPSPSLLSSREASVQAGEDRSAPSVVILEPREHVDSLRDLSDATLAEMGVMLARVERAVLSVEGIERVHILR